MNREALKTAVLAADNLSNQLMLIQQNAQFATPDRLQRIDELLETVHDACQSMHQPIITANHLHILRRALGLTSGQHSWLNQYFTRPESNDFALCQKLVSIGLMERHGPFELTGGGYKFVVTTKGKNFVEANP